MGLLGAFAAGAGAAGAETINSWMKFDQQMELLTKRLEMESTQRRADKTWEIDQANAQAEKERARVSGYMKPVVSNPNGLLADNANLTDDESRGDEGVGRDVQDRSRTPTVKEASMTALQAGDLDSATKIGKLDDSEEKMRTQLIIAEMNNKYRMDKLSQTGQLAMLKLAQSIAKNGEGKLPGDAQMIEYLVKEGIVSDKKAAADWLKQGKTSDSGYDTVEYDGDGNVSKRVVKTPTNAKDTVKPEADKFVVGKKYKDKNGIVRTYKGNNQWG